MKLRLIPREERFFDLFVEDAANVLGAARLLETMLRSYSDVESRAAEVRDAERRGGAIRRDIGERVSTTFVPPFDREDVEALAAALDDVLDGIEEAADTFVLYAIGAPTAAAVELASIIVRQTEQIHGSLGRLEGFVGLDPYLREIERLGNDGDRVSRAAIAALFEGVDAIEVIRWRKVYSVLEATIDRCDDTADIIGRITLRNA